MYPSIYSQTTRENMINGKKVIVVLPAYNAAKTLVKTIQEIPPGIVDVLVLVDDASEDSTLDVANSLGLNTIRHSENLGYGANQKTCFAEALRLQADVVVMLHPDYQYSPLLIPAMASMVAVGQYDIVLGSRILGRGALAGGMPMYKYLSNRLLTFIENILLNRKYSEYHTGYRAFSNRALQIIPYENNSNDFIFDNQIIAQAVYLDLEIGEISCPANYDSDSSSINFIRSVKYGIGVLITAISYRISVTGLWKPSLFSEKSSTQLALNSSELQRKKLKIDDEHSK
jgi:glycosyltransferase involved in cell wall biosynthesis